MVISIICKSVMIIIFVEFIDHLIDYLINCASLSHNVCLLSKEGVKIYQAYTVLINGNNGQADESLLCTVAAKHMNRFQLFYIYPKYSDTLTTNHTSPKI